MERALLSATLLLAGLATLLSLASLPLLGASLGIWGAALVLPGTLIGIYARSLAVSRGEVGWALAISLAVFLAVALGLMAGAALSQAPTANGVLILTGLAQGGAGGAALCRLSAGQPLGLGQGVLARWRVLLRRAPWPLAGGLAGEIATRFYIFMVTAWAGPTAMAALAVGQTLLRPATLLAGAWAGAARSALAQRHHAGDHRGFMRIVLLGSAGPALATLLLGVTLAGFWPQVAGLAFGGRFSDLAGIVLLWTANMSLSCFVFSYGVALQAQGRLRAAAKADIVAAVMICISMPILLLLLPPASALFAMILGSLAQIALQARALRQRP